MQVLLTNIELDIQELKCLMDAYTREPNTALREVIRRSISLMRGRLDTLLLNLDAATLPDVQKPIEEVAITQVVIEPVEPAKPVVDTILPIADAVLPIVEEVNHPVETQDQLVDEKPEAVSVAILGERIKTSVDLCRSISLNDSFRFSRELFDGDAERMNRVLRQIGEMSTYTAALSFLSSKIKVDEENEAMVDLLELLKKYFN